MLGIHTFRCARRYLTIGQAIGYLLDDDRRHAGSHIHPLDWLEWKRAGRHKEEA